MKQTARILSTYSADTFGVCSALYELGGMVVIHDPSGCNSTYTTHDEPRWFSEPSQIFVSALTEQDAILGNDAKLIADIEAAAKELQPRFICLIPSQIAHMIATDCRAICHILEKKTGIPAFTLPTNSMHYYERGIYFALQKLADFACQSLPEPGAVPEPVPAASWLSEEKLEQLCQAKGAPLHVNVLGATPLDFAMNGSIDSIRHWLEKRGCRVTSCWVMGSDLDAILASHRADLNLVVSYGGLGAARVLRERAGIPYLVGLPFPQLQPIDTPSNALAGRPAYIIGETVFAGSLACALEAALGLPRAAITTIVPMETDSERAPAARHALPDGRVRAHASPAQGRPHHRRPALRAHLPNERRLRLAAAHRLLRPTLREAHPQSHRSALLCRIRAKNPAHTPAE